MSLNDLRNQILSNSDEERVEVDQRSLIDKILARYPSKFVIYRELMQNADDAKTSSIQIIFETENNEMDETNGMEEIIHETNEAEEETEDNEVKEKVIRTLFKNNGRAFDDDDWNRLKRIADGNPDEEKIGAFGVGFYSLFSICDNPFISSGKQAMAFYWRGNQLFTKQGPTDDDGDDGWTTFLMDMKKPIELPNIEEFARFLANSLVFTESIQEVSVYYSDMLVIQLSKKMQCLRSIDVTSFYTFSPRMMFQLTSIDVRNVQLDLVEYQTEKKSIRLRIASGNLNVRVDDRFSEEMERIIKKKPPRKTSIQMVFTGFDEYNSSRDYEYPVFKDLLSYPGQGSIYIGFPTNQTTGCCSHLSARVIPTISRVSIDFANTTLAKYNNEMLCLAGTLYRVLYEDEMDQIERLYNEKINVDVEDDENTGSIRESIEKRAAYALAYFTFHPSTPEAKVGEMAESQFFSCLKKELSILSTNGVHPISDVRMPNSEMSGFMKTVPVFPKIILEQCEMFFKKAKNMIKELTLQDVLRELKNRTLSEDEMVELLKWWISYRSKGNNVNSEFMRLACIGDRSRPLNKFGYFLNPSVIPPDVVVPADVLPYTISKKLKDQKREFRNQDFKKWFEWSELSLVHWAKFIVNKPDLEANPPFSEEVLKILAKSLNNTSQDNQVIIRGLFKNKKCIPTRSGMIIPNEAYFENVNIFPDLPTIQFQNSSPSLNNLMELLGVRKVVKLELIFDRLDSQDSQGICDHMQLIKYLASKLDELKDDEIETLRNKPIWPRENLAGSQPDNNESKGINPKSRFIVSHLYTPLTTNREFRLPVIDWKGKWSRNSSEGKFLIMLGLQEYPTLEKILELAAPLTDSEIRNKALRYFINNFEKNYSYKYYNSPEADIAFLPCSDSNTYAKPSECFISPECSIMKFKVIHQDFKFYVEKIGVRQHPDHKELVNRLTRNIPQDENNAKEVFEYLASRCMVDFTHSDWDTLARSNFIPIKQHNKITYTNPRNCYFEIESDLNDFFTRIDFGERANKFLEYCGVKNKPSSMDFAELLVKSSRELLSAIKPEKYLDILRTIACDFSKISKQLIKQMKKAPILLAVKKKAGTKELNYSLALAKEIYINDDTIYREVFNPLTAPEEDFLENDLYKKLGCKSLHGSVKETSKPEGIIRETRKSHRFQARIVKRAILFYHNCPKNKVKRDKEWVEKLKVFQTERIETNYKLKDIRETREVGTIILQDTLYITDKSGWLDISRQLVKNIYKSDDSRDALCLNTLLTTEDLSDLEKIGYPVDRIMRQPPEPQHIQHITYKNYNNSPLNIKSPIPILSTPPFAGDSASLGARNFVSKSNLVKLNNNVKPIKPVTIEGPTKNYSNINVTCSPTIINHQNNINIDIYYSLRYSGREIHGIKLYDTEGLSQSYDVPLKQFVDMLKSLASVFRPAPKLINVFYDNNANPKIAFNSDGELFFNLQFYLKLHEEKCRVKPTINAMTYWFLIFCHILERNEIPIHHEVSQRFMTLFKLTSIITSLIIFLLFQ